MNESIFPEALLGKYELKGAFESDDLNAFIVMHKLMKKQMFVYVIESSDSEKLTSRLHDNGSTVFDRYADGNKTYIIVDKPLNEIGEKNSPNKIDQAVGLSDLDKKHQGLFSRKLLILLACSVVLFGITYIMYINNVFGYRISEDEEVDLGLSVLWSSRNLGASSVEQDGDFYAWGETEPKTEYTEGTYLYSSNNNYSFIGEDISGTQYDAASVKMKNGWRMPTKSELEELFTKCKWEKVYHKSVTGFVVTGPNNNSIFIPCSGHMDGTFHYGNTYYWSSTFHDEPERGRRCNAWNLAVDIGTNHIYQRRYIGRVIRPVKNK